MIDYFNAIAVAQNDAHRAQALEDYHNDMSGDNVGRITRTIIHGENFDANGNKRKNKSDLASLIISTKEYAVYHTQLTDTVRATRTKADTLIEKIDNAMEAAEKRLEAGLNNAITLPNGRKAFLDTETGIAWADDGTELDEALTAGIDWNGKITHAEHLSNQDTLSKLQDYKAQTDNIILELADDQNTLEDTKEGGLTRDDMDAMQDRIDANETDLDIIRNDVERLYQSNPTHEINLTGASIAPVRLLDFD